MLRILCAVALACLLATAAEARQRHHIAGTERSCIPTSDQMRPCTYQPNFLAGVRSISITMHRDRHPANPRPRLAREAASYEGRPTGCPHAWCGCYLAAHLGIPNRSLWLARNWANIGSPVSGPQVGAIAVWPHHVGKITAVDGNRILLLSGNDGHAVRERWRPVRGIIAYRNI